jgi:hypothetical protein
MGTRRSAWRRARATLLAVTVTAVAALAGTAPAGAATDGPGQPAPPPGPTLEVSGEFTGTGQLLGTCGLFRQVVDGGGEWLPLGTTTFTLDFCLENPVGELYPISSGTFTVTSPSGTLTGTVGGWVEAGGNPDPAVGFPLHITLTVTGGTGAYAGATGDLLLEGAFGYGAATVWGTVSGTVTLPPPTPDSADDCRNGGWRQVVDDQGRPFRSQGACIAWVRHHTA